MKPLYLKLKGFMGIRTGCGKECVTLDLTQAGTGLIAITGPNGAGKSTILDNMHPFRLMPFRSSTYSSAAFSYYDHCYGDAMKELEFEVQV